MKYTSEIAERPCHDELCGRARRTGNSVGLAKHADARLLPRLIPHALQREIETDYCRWLIRTRKLPPPDPSVVYWHWQIRIRTLGQFEVLIDEQPLIFEGKAQQKPMSILKELLPSPAGVDSGGLMQRLWPDLDGDAARNAFDLALHRLRLRRPRGNCSRSYSL